MRHTRGRRRHTRYGVWFARAKLALTSFTVTLAVIGVLVCINTHT